MRTYRLSVETLVHESRSDRFGVLLAYAFGADDIVPGRRHYLSHLVNDLLCLDRTKQKARVQELALHPGNFTESGYAYIEDRFKAMKLMLLLSRGVELITSDWPRFDMKDSTNSPLLGEEIGRDPGVVCYLPLSPVFGAVFFSGALSTASAKVPRLTANVITGSNAKNRNVLVIQKAERFVVASKAEDYVFRVAAKRKKSRPPTE